jgi:hypothetical protein
MGSCDDRKSSISRLKAKREISDLGLASCRSSKDWNELQVKVVPLVQSCHIILPEQVRIVNWSPREMPRGKLGGKFIPRSVSEPFVFADFANMGDTERT